MSDAEYGSEDESVNPNYSASSEDITAGLRTLRLPSRVSSNTSTRNPSIKSPVIAQGAIAQSVQSTQKNALQELLNYSGDASFDWADDMPDFNSTANEDQFILLQTGTRNSSWRDDGDVDTSFDTANLLGNPKVRGKNKKSKDRSLQNQHPHQNHSNNQLGGHGQGQRLGHNEHKSNKSKHQKKEVGLSNEAMRLMPVAGWKPDKQSENGVEDDVEVETEGYGHVKNNDYNYHNTHHLIAPPDSKDNNHELYNSLPSKYALESKYSSESLETSLSRTKSKSRSKSNTKKYPKSDSNNENKPSAEVGPVVTRIHYTHDVKKEDKPKKVELQSKWA